MLKKLSLVLAAILAIQSAQAAPTPTVHPHNDFVNGAMNNLGDFSVQCGEDLGKVYQDQNVLGIMAKLGADIAKGAQEMSSACQATIFPCTTMAGKGNCCSINGASIWGAHSDWMADLSSLQSAGAATGVSGSAIGMGKIQTMIIGGAPYSVSASYIAPAYVPDSCQNLNDETNFNIAASTQCMKTPIPGAEIRSCVMVW